ncbi:alpha-amylase family glycosyl hydrolase [Streptomyces albiaxialis]|uniref:1,4-alpha-glucan branching enzyme n=1 Tax=Streptomyces albiaxialis TaxID=329523 RepID=A0ABP5I930_9ACTN
MSRPVMGAVPYDGGAAFRVWAPHARAVAVTGSFNAWQVPGVPLAPEDGGRWAGEVPGVKPGDAYKYVITAASGEELWRADPFAAAMTGSPGDALVTEREFDWSGTEDYRPPARDELVLYEMHVGTFNDEPGGGPGRFADVLPRLPHLAGLGVNAIELMPAAEFPGGFSWGYNPSAPFAVETDLGGPLALKGLVREAHRHGIAVLLDVVYNHLGPGDLILWRYDGWHEGEHGGGIYFYNDWRARTPWGHTRPDYGRPEVRAYLRDNALHWLEEYRMDGLRWDATAYIRDADGTPLPDGWNLMRWVNDEIDRRAPLAFSVAEDLRGDPRVTAPTGAGGAGFDAQWDADFVHPVRRAVIATEDRDRDMGAVRAAIEHRFDGGEPRRVVYTESHDEVANGHARVPEEIWPGSADSWFSKKRSTLGAALVLTVPGVPMLFQGQEFLEDRWFDDQDPLDWTRASRFRGLIDLYRDLIALRRDLRGTTAGLRGDHVSVFHVNDTDKCLAYHRRMHGGPRDDTVVVANFANRGYAHYSLGMPRGGLWRVRFNSDWEGYDPAFGGHPAHDTEAVPVPRDGLPCTAALALGPYTAVILSQD